MARIIIVPKPQDISTLSPEDRPYGWIQLLPLTSADKYENVHDVTWHMEDILTTIGQNEVMGLTLLPAKYFKLDYDNNGLILNANNGEEFKDWSIQKDEVSEKKERPANLSFGQCLVGVEKIEIVKDENGELTFGTGKPTKGKIYNKVSSIMAMSCEPGLDTRGGNVRKYYLV